MLEFLSDNYIELFRQREMNAIRAERERQEMLNIQKKLDIDQIESAIDAKRNEIAEKRAEELVDAYLKNKQMRVRFY
jgi:hypothetical protein